MIVFPEDMRKRQEKPMRPFAHRDGQLGGYYRRQGSTGCHKKAGERSKKRSSGSMRNPR